jgi:hypothetical protein
LITPSNTPISASNSANTSAISRRWVTTLPKPPSRSRRLDC